MSELTVLNSGADLLDAASFHASLEGSDLPPWAVERKRSAWQRFEQLPMPKGKEQPWRYASVRNVKLEGYHVPSAPPSEAERARVLELSEPLKEISGALVFADGHLISQTPLPDELAAKGVILEPLDTALRAHPEILEKYFMAERTRLGSEKFEALHEAYFNAGTVLYIPKGVEVPKPITVLHWAVSSQVALFPHTLIVAEDNTSVDLVDFYGCLDAQAPALVCGVGDVHAGPGSQVFRKVVQNWSRQTLSFQTDGIVADRDANVKTVSVNLGGKQARFENQIRIAEPGAHVKMYGLTVADGEQEFDQRTLQIHEAPNAVSDLLYKNALMDQAHTIFSGLIKVEKDAQQTDAYQTNRNLLLEPTAEANSLPGLEIEANDVKCSHGATSGQLDPNEMFYLYSRGIPKRVAYELMVFGFFEEIVEKISDETLREVLRGLVQDKFRAHVS
ncbi:MAG: Fe-S cluster assembly protein SufD [Opitutales bacterium]